MSWKTLTTFVTDLVADSRALDAAVALAGRYDAHLDVLCLGVDVTQPEVYFSGAQTVTLASAMQEADRSAKALEAAVKERLDHTDLRWSVASAAVPMLGLSTTVADAARFSDLVIAAKPYGAGSAPAQVQIVEAALFGAAAAVLVIPDAPLPPAFNRVALAWNDSPEALRATRAALPVMTRASQTEIVIVDPARHGPDRSDPGGRLGQILARHGIAASIRILARSMPSVADILRRHLDDSAADLLVMGAYGHSRLRQSILGGVTREMLEQATVPMLMVH